MNKKTLVIALVVVAVLVAGGVAAWQYSKNKSLTGRAAMPGGANSAAGLAGRGARGANANFGGASGKVLSKDSNSLTVQLSNGGSAIVFYSGSTRVSKTVDVQTGDLAVGQIITARGTKGVDGTILADTVQIRPADSSASNGTSTQRYQAGTVGQNRGQQAGGNASGTTATGGNNGGFASGQITAINGGTITVKGASGAEQTITLADGAKITNTTTASIDDVVEGTDVMITGQKNSDGSINAQMIQLGNLSAMPAGRMNGGQPGAGQPAAPSQNY